MRNRNHNMRPFYIVNTNKQKRGWSSPPSSSLSGKKCQKSINKHMIIDFTRKSNTNKAVSEEEFKGFGCPKCNAQDLKYYSTYTRWALTLESEGLGRLTLKSTLITVYRGKCGSCKKTHAILPGDIIPYKQYSLETVVTLLTYVLSDKLTVICVEKLLGIPHQIIYGILKQWSAMLIRLALMLRDTFNLYTITGLECDNLSILRFIGENMHRAPQAFLRYFKWPMFMTWSQNIVPQKVSIGTTE